MLTNIPFLFILSLIITFSLSQENTDACNATNAASRNDCFARSVPNRYCCFDSQNKPCQSISKEALKTNTKYDCGIIDERYGKYEFNQYHPPQPSAFQNLGFETCGKRNPEKKKIAQIIQKYLIVAVYSPKEMIKHAFISGENILVIIRKPLILMMMSLLIAKHLI